MGQLLKTAQNFPALGNQCSYYSLWFPCLDNVENSSRMVCSRVLEEKFNKKALHAWVPITYRGLCRQRGVCLDKRPLTSVFPFFVHTKCWYPFCDIKYIHACIYTYLYTCIYAKRCICNKLKHCSATIISVISLSDFTGYHQNFPLRLQ